MSESDLLKLQISKLQAVLPYICSMDFYREKISEITIDFDSQDPLTGLREMPFTYKDELRSTSPMTRTPLNVEDIMAFFSSSGTTGEPSVYVWSKKDQCVLEKIGKRLLQNIGVGPGDVALLPLPMGMHFAWYAIFREMYAVSAAVVPLGSVPLEKIAQAQINYPITILKTSPVIASRLFRMVIENNPFSPYPNAIASDSSGGLLLQRCPEETTRSTMGR